MNNKFLKNSFLAVMILTILFAPVAYVSAVPHGQDDAPPEPAIETGSQQPGPSGFIELKFIEGSSARLVDGILSASRQEDIEEVYKVFNTFSVTEVARLFSQPEEEIDALNLELQRSVDEPLPNLNLWFRIKVPDGVDSKSLIEQLQNLPEVQYAYEAPVAAPPHPSAFHPICRNPLHQPFPITKATRVTSMRLPMASMPVMPGPSAGAKAKESRSSILSIT